MSDSYEPAWRHLHPASILVNLVPTAWRTLRGAWPLLLVMLFGGGGLGVRAVDLFTLLFFAGLTVLSTFVHWATLRYRVRGGKLEIKSGLLFRRSRSIDPVRIQNMELVQNLFHKATGLVELRVDTAGDLSTEGMLSALSVGEAEELRSALRQSTGAPRAIAEAAPSTELLRIGVLELVAFGFSRQRMGTVAVLTAVSMEALSVLSPADAAQVTRSMGPGALLAALVLATSAAWLLSAGQALHKHFRFRLRHLDDRLMTEEGLTTRRRVEIPLAKVQLVRTDEPLVRRGMGYGTVLIETAGLGIEEGRVRQAEGVVPMVPHHELAWVGAQAVPNAGVDPWSSALLPAHPRALYRAAIAGLLRSGAIAGALTVLFFPWGLVAGLYVPWTLFIAYMDWRRQGWLVTPTAVVTQRGWLTRRTWVIARDKLQSVHVVQGPLMRWHGLGRPLVAVAGTQVALPDVSEEQARSLLAELCP